MNQLVSSNIGTLEKSVSQNDELGYLQEIIAQHEKHAFTVMALMAAVLTGLGTLTFSWKVGLTPQEVWQIGIVAIIAFSAWALSHRAVAAKCIIRVREIEDDIKKGSPYTGPVFSSSLIKIPLNIWREAFLYRTNSIPIFIGFGVVFFMSLLSERLQSLPEKSILNTSTINSQIIQAAQSNTTISVNSLLIEENFATATTTTSPQTCIIILTRISDKSVDLWPIKKIECN